MKLSKANQKLDNNICKSLTVACESSLGDIVGFSWLTHRVDYTNFPASLVVTCVFNADEDIEIMLALKQDEILRATIQKQLLKVGIVVKNIKQCVRFDSEQACERQHGGQWSDRLALNIPKYKPWESAPIKH